MADEQKPEGPPAAPPPDGEAAAPPANQPLRPPKPHLPSPPRPLTQRLPNRRPPWRRHPGTATSREIKERFGDRIVETSTYLGQNFVVVKPDSAVPVIEYLKLEADFDYLVDITAVDWPKRAERFDVVYILYSFARNERVRVKTTSPRATSPKPRSTCT
jgi:NADH-quinone oxidoreductase subunit C